MPITGPDPGCLQAVVRLAEDELPLKLVVAAALVASPSIPFSKFLALIFTAMGKK